VEVHIGTERERVFCTAVAGCSLRILKLIGSILFYAKTIYCSLLFRIAQDHGISREEFVRKLSSSFELLNFSSVQI